MDEQALLGLNPNADSDFRQREARRNTLIKDTMREQCIPNLVESWYQILQNYQYTNSEVTCQCLEVVGAYVSWIDLSLIANDRFINMLLGHMSIEVLREEACDCLFEIVNKGMDPVDKMKLVESLCQVLQSAGFFSIDQEEDVDFLARFSKLVNGMGQSLIVSWTKLIKSGDIKNAQEALQAVETKVALMLQLLIHEDDDISSNIIGFCYDYLHILKQLTVLSDQQKANVEAIMLAVMKKLTYDEEYNFENEGEDEAMFVEYRKQLKLLLDRLAQVSPELLLASVRRVFSSTLQNWQTTRFMEVEVAIRLLYMLAEALPVSHGAHFSGDVSKASALQDMMRTLVTSGVSAYQHTSVTLEFFETVVRYEKFFTVEPQHIPGVLENGYQSLLSSDDQLFIYETAGVLIVNSEYPAERKQALMRNLLTPLMEKFKILLEKLMMAQDEERQACLADCLNHAVGFASRTSKAFSNKQTVKQCGCSEVYLDCLQTFLPALSCPLQKDILRSGVRTFLHRMIICLEEEVLPFIPSASEHMLKDCEAKDLQEFIPLINQITAKFKALSECAVTLKTIHLKRGPECVQYLQQEYLPSLQVAPEIIQFPLLLGEDGPSRVVLVPLILLRQEPALSRRAMLSKMKAACLTSVAFGNVT
ncbi:exportin-T [Camelus ferus]|nr:exportin-T [Camelus ferus]